MFMLVFTGTPKRSQCPSIRHYPSYQLVLPCQHSHKLIGGVGHKVGVSPVGGPLVHRGDTYKLLYTSRLMLSILTTLYCLILALLWVHQGVADYSVCVEWIMPVSVYMCWCSVRHVTLLSLSANGCGTSGAHATTLGMVQLHLRGTSPLPIGFANTGSQHPSSS